jgi:hypothetical protein
MVQVYLNHLIREIMNVLYSLIYGCTMMVAFIPE